jgi:hypothetical protein
VAADGDHNIFLSVAQMLRPHSQLRRHVTRRALRHHSLELRSQALQRDLLEHMDRLTPRVMQQTRARVLRRPRSSHLHLGPPKMIAAVTLRISVAALAPRASQLLA